MKNKIIEKPKKNKSGIYQFIDKNNIVIYIGSSKNLYERIRNYQNSKNKLKESLINSKTVKIEYIYAEDYKEQEKILIERLQPKYNKQLKVQYSYLPRNEKYIDIFPLMKAMENADIGLIPTKKGVGKTIEMFRRMLNKFIENGKPSFYVRTTIEQLEEFVLEDKFLGILKLLNFPITRDTVISRKGLFVMTYDKKSKKKRKKPIIYFVSINEAMKIQSSKFETGNYLVADELLNHFTRNNMKMFDKFLNTTSSVLREANSKIFILFNKINNNDIVLQKFMVDRQIQKIKKGHVKRFYIKAGKDTETNQLVMIMIAVYNPLLSKKLIESQAKSISNKLSYLSDYGKVINSSEFYIELSKIKSIKKYGDFEGIINFNGFKIGLWICKQNQDYQFSSKYNKNGKQYFLDIGEYSIEVNLIKEDFIINLKNKLLMREVQFDNGITLSLIIKILESINLYKNEKNAF